MFRQGPPRFPANFPQPEKPGWNNNATSAESSETSSESSSGSSEGKTSDVSSGSSSSSGSDKSGSSDSSKTSSTTSSESRKKKKKRGYFRRMWKSSPEEHLLLKMAVWFPIGLVLSFAFYFMVIDKLNMKPALKQFIGAVIGFLLSLTFAVSVQMRCVMTLVIPTFLGKAGRSYLSAFALVYLINGPITNIVDNGKEIVRSLTCTSSLMANHTKEKWRLRLHPVENAFGDLAKDGFLFKKAAKAIDKAFKPLRGEIESNEEESQKLQEDIKKAQKLNEEAEKAAVSKEGEGKEKILETNEELGKKVEAEWEKKQELRCQDIFTKGVVRCVEELGKLHGRCMDKLWLLGYLFCWPLKITAFCKLITLLPGALGMSCSKLKVVEPGFGQTYIAARAVIDDMEKGMEVKMQYKIVGDVEAVDYTPVEEMRQATIQEVTQKADLMSFLLSIISYILTFAFILIFKSAYDYNKKYLTEFSFDNIYVTRYFRRIDARRKDREKKTLLPLKKYESKDIIFPSDRSNVGHCYMDGLLYQILDIVSRNSAVEYHQEGEHVINIKVGGNGFMSALVRSFLEKFNTNQTLNKISTNHACLPNPSRTELTLIVFLFLTYFIILIFIYFEAFGLRLRRVIASFYYRKREKKRVLFLYNEMFRKRLGFLKHMRKRVRKQIKERELQNKIGLIVALQKQFPRLCGCLRVFQSNKASCIICNDPEDKEFHICGTKGCGIAYCRLCWKDIKRKCYACGKDTDSDVTDVEDLTSDSAPSDDSDLND
ncbi:E3 ubiquitin-protein ligase DCST1-like [Physella acuta]|uniref:E3 ubiquitin-protein ligase DCST1-like n=1 Tax=Physella acuta TaxID=109671 RepID=UPI0027DB15BB|nr:E3 ubiquitin-protein ligase DCST1-like [Physella acuta]